MAWRIWSAILAGLLLCGAARAQDTPPGGIYVIVDATSTAQYDLARETMKRPDVDGLLIHLRWSDINPDEKTFRWEALNEAVDIAVRAHKRFEIGVVTGEATPQWVIKRSVHGTFSYYAAALARCATFTMALPYDAHYLQAFHDMLHGLAKDLHEHKTYDHLGMIKLFGITTTTNELRLPAVASKECGAPDPVTEWAGLGYTPDLVAMGWGDMLHMYNAEFPDKSFNIGFIGINAFPGIGHDGQPLPPKDRKAASARFTERLIDAAAHAMPGRLALGFDSLTRFNNVPSYQEYLDAFDAAARKAKIPIGWQTNELLGNYPYGGAACSGNEPVKNDGGATAAVAGGGADLAFASTNPTKPCASSRDFRDMLAIAIEHRVHHPAGELDSVYLEIFPQNAVMYPSALIGLKGELSPWGP